MKNMFFTVTLLAAGIVQASPLPVPCRLTSNTPPEQARAICSWAAFSGQTNIVEDGYTQLSAEHLDLLQRIPSASRGTSLHGIWRVTDTHRTVVALFNWKTSEKRFDETPARLGLASGVEVAVFDYWRDTLLPSFTERLTVTVPPHACAVLALCPLTDRPQVISTSRHITQDVSDIVWDTATRTLSGISQTSPGIPYELRILTRATLSIGAPSAATISTGSGHPLTILPGDGVATRPENAYANANTSAAPYITLYEPKIDNGLVRLTFISDSGEPISWRITFY